MKKQSKLIFVLFFFCYARLHAQEDPDPLRFQQEIEAFRQWDAKNAVPAHPVLFIGSSSIRLWKTAEAFPDLPVVNRGFGGAHFSDLLYYLPDILLKYPEPAAIVLYCGDNDAAAGKSSTRIVDDFRKFLAAAQSRFPKTPIVYIPIKPSPSRWAIWPTQREVNERIRALCRESNLLFYADTVTPMLAAGEPPADELFLDDRLHLSEKGYAVWQKVVSEMLHKILKQHQ
ncbi:MAG: GDSL-type esterase/lipase family protein [candidate division KSB1 bacterium]|nr:GDSL-type esterase/lipase family protein [candidate division KSB1 bacterium]